MVYCKKLPQEITITLEVDGKKYDDIEDYIEEVTKDFFNVSRSDYENLKDWELFIWKHKQMACHVLVRNVFMRRQK